jgi:hypothetical protein
LRRHTWHLFNIAMLLQLVGVFTADSTTSKTLHALAVLGFGLVARTTRPKHPPTPRYLDKQSGEWKDGEPPTSTEGRV